jgi:hypothetical protein
MATIARTLIDQNRNAGVFIESGGDATIRESTISGNAPGVDAFNSSLTLTRSTIKQNTLGVRVVFDSTYEITNNFIVRNTGDDAGAVFDSPGVFEFNTLSHNVRGSAGSVVNCNGIQQLVTFSNNIVVNTGCGIGICADQDILGANCAWAFSIVPGNTPTLGAGNITGDPMFVDVANNDFHLKPTSPCKDAANPAATLAEDFDGEARPAGSARDIGADEVQ